ncbi:MAG: tripartite tricarboxylate transporter substrate binding protein, partial [Hydrogenophaga sp.]|uniref:Bug family tripartite tricarboxylate transporter substrate binding protein n=1 Tax=Hydrogenophaga sp. TaxID=1904254 RepID=UPI00273352A3
LKTMKDVVEQMKKDMGSVKWGGGSRGSTEHIAAAMLAREVGLDASKVNYVPFRGGGEAVAAILGNNVSVGGSGYSEFQQYIESGKMKAIAITSGSRVKGIDVPTLKEQGIDVEIGNWRGVYGAPGITQAQRDALTAMVVKATQSKAWAAALEKNNWMPALLTGKAFDEFVDKDFSSLRATMVRAGMV